jgi:hypothetical protein
VSASYIALSGSYNTFSGSASTRVTKIENNYATTGSNSFRADQSITGSLVVSSTITAQTLVVQTVTSSIVYSSGSNLFGNALANTQTFTGSVNITGSLTVNTTGTEFQVTNLGVIMGNLLTDAHSITGSLRVTGSTILNGGLTGTSAAFTEGFINGTTDAFFHVNRSASGNAGRIRFQTAGTTNFQMGLVGGLSGLRMLNSEGTTTFTMLESGETTFINNTILSDGYYISTRTDNTSALRTHLMMRRGNASGKYADIFTSGDTANGAGSIQFGFNSSPKMILTDGGNLTVGDYTPTDTFGAGRVIDIGSSAGGSIVLRDTTSPTTQYGGMSYTGDSDNGLRMWSNGFFAVNLSSVRRFTIANNGDITLVSGAALFFGGSSLTYVAGGDSSMTLAVNGGTALTINSSRQVRINSFITGYDGSSAHLQINGFMRIGGQIIYHNPDNVANEISVACSAAGTLTVSGNQTVTGTKSFQITHPLDNKKTLFHYSTESPKADLIYRGKINLVNGKATINIDLSSKMTEGTFVALCRDIQCFTTNESGWDTVKGKVIGNILTIDSDNQNSSDEISWMVIGERYDESILNSYMLDEDGDLIVEKEKDILETNNIN